MFTGGNKLIKLQHINNQKTRNMPTERKKLIKL